MKNILIALMLMLCVGTASANYFENQADKPHPWGMDFKERAWLATGFGVLTAVALAHSDSDQARDCVASLGSSLTVGTLLQPRDGWIVGIGVGAARELDDDESKYHRRDDDLRDFGVSAACATAGYGLFYAPEAF